MKFITCASYYGTGSSAVTDYVSEFNTVFSFTDEEFRFIQDPDGISDLEFNLVECFNRHNSGHALKRYKRLVDLYCGNFLVPRYRRFFGDGWKNYSYQYINDLTDFTYHGWWHYDLFDRGTWFWLRKRLVNKILHKTIWRNNPDRSINTMTDEITYCSHPTEEKFLRCTREYIYKLFESVKPQNIDTIMVDQLVPPMNLPRYLRYFDDNIKVVVVDRDPRDVFFLDKYVWKDGIIPNDVETFCKWFHYTRDHRKYESMNTDYIKFIQFEDLVYHYDQTGVELREWLGLDEKNHLYKRKYFDPAVSIHNTQVWKKFPDYDREREFIEKALPEYLYDF
ncbi:hypothetical protein [Mitsuokella sp.]